MYKETQLTGYVMFVHPVYPYWVYSLSFISMNWLNGSLFTQYISKCTLSHVKSGLSPQKGMNQVVVMTVNAALYW